MASLALGAIGGFFFGPIGFMIGSLIGNLLFPAKTPDGPRLSNLKLQNSQYGQMIPFVYGTMRVAGNVIWSTDLIEHKHESGGKGGPSQTTYSYSCSFAVDLCMGPIDSIATIWANGTVIWSTTGTGTTGGPIPCTLYVGDETQLPDPTIEAKEGVGNVPGNRGKAYVVFDDWDLTAYGNMIPNLNFEILVKGGGEAPLSVVASYLYEPPTNPDQPDAVDRWAFRYGSLGIIGTLFPVITHWALDGSDIRIKPLPVFHDASVEPDDHGGLVFTYSNPSLVADGDDHLADPYPYATYSGLGARYAPIGTYVYAAGTTEDVWILQGAGVPVGTGSEAAIGSLSVQCTDSSPPFAEVNFAYDAGMTAGEYVLATALTQDGTALLALTGATQSSITKWYLIVNGAVTTTGTVSPAINGEQGVIGFGNAASQSNDAFLAVNALENDRKTLWVFDGFSHSVRIYKITGSNFALDTVVGSLSCPSLTYTRPGHVPPSSADAYYPAITIPANGYAGICVGTALYLISRFSGPAPTTLAEIVSDISVRAGLSTSDIDVSALTDIVPGYIINQQQPCRDDITPLQSAYFFDAVESSGVVKFVKRGADPVVTIPDGDLAAQTGGTTPPPLVTVKRVQEVDLPQNLTVAYVNAANDYQTGTQVSQRQTVESQMSISMELTISLSDLTAKQVANTLLFAAWLERNQCTFLTSRQYDYLEPTDVVNVHGYEVRIMAKSDVASDVVQFDGVTTIGSIWQQAPTPVAGIGFTPSLPPGTTEPTAMLLLDIPMVNDTDDPEGFRVGLAGSVAGGAWGGANLYQSLDNGVTYNLVDSFNSVTVMGTVTALPSAVFGAGNVFDESSIFEVTIGPGGGELASADYTAVLNGQNAAMLGAEMIQFKNATLTGAGVYDLTGMLRGRRGTEWALRTHTLGEPFALLSSTQDVAETPAQVSQILEYQAVTFGQSLGSGPVVQFVNTANAALCYSPVQLGGGSDTSGDVTLKWNRRTRSGGAWLNLTDVPVSEASELYVVQIWDSTYSNCARVITGVTSPSYLYTSAMQVADFGENQQMVFFSVGQIGEFKLGTQGRGIATGQGSSNDAPLSPVTPYNGPAGPPPGMGPGCTLPTVTSTLAFGNGNSVVLGSPLTPGTEWVISFTTPGSPISQAVDVVLLSQAGTTWPVLHAVLATSPCGAPLASGSKVDAISFGITGYMTGNPDPSRFATLATSTTYYLTVSTDAALPIGVEMLLL